jgi:hypothetical protein
MANQSDRDAALYAEATVAAILTLGTLPQSAGGHSENTVIARYKAMLQKLRDVGVKY